MGSLAYFFFSFAWDGTIFSEESLGSKAGRELHLLDIVYSVEFKEVSVTNLIIDPTCQIWEGLFDHSRYYYDTQVVNYIIPQSGVRYLNQITNSNLNVGHGTIMADL